MGMLDQPMCGGKVPFAQSETKKNLLRAFAGESQARNRYTFAAGQAKKEGYALVEKIFQFTADQEKEHAKIFYNHLIEEGAAGENITIGASYPWSCSAPPTTTNIRNLKKNTLPLPKKQEKRATLPLPLIFR